MSALLENERPEGCLSDLRLDVLLSGAGGDGAHLVGCERCRARLVQLREAQHHAEQVLPRTIVPAVMPPNRRRRTVLVGVLVAAGVACIAMVGALRFATPSDETHLKGRASLTVFVQRDGQMHEAPPGGAVYPKDRLQFAYTTPRDTYLGILSLDGQGRASIYVPQATTSQWVPRASKAATSNSVVLDDVLGPERLFGVFCERPFDLTSLREELSARGTLDGGQGCEVEVLILEKVTPP